MEITEVFSVDDEDVVVSEEIFQAANYRKSSSVQIARQV
jgi:hypothetical protein